MPYENSVIKIYATGLVPNYRQPFASAKSCSWTGSGFILKYGDTPCVVTNAHVVSNTNFIQVKLASDSTRYTAKVLKIGHDCDLALLKIEDNKFWNMASLLVLAEKIQVEGKVNVLGFPAGGIDFCMTEGTITRTEVASYVYNNIPLLTTHIDASIDHGNSGGPVISVDQTVVGVVHQGGKLGHMIPLPILTHFLDDALNNKNYQGFPMISLILQEMENPALRRYYQLDNAMTGVLVVDVDPFSPAYRLLKKDDVILQIGPYAIKNDGMIKYPGFNTQIKFTHAINMCQLHDSVTFTVLREGQKQDISVTLTKVAYETDLHPCLFGQTEPAYFVRAGVVIQPVSLNLYNSYVQENVYRGPLVFANVATTRAKKEEKKLKEFVVGAILEDDNTQCYGNLVNTKIQYINGKSLSTMWSAINAFDLNEKPYHIIEMTSGQKMVLPKLSTEEDFRLRKRYQIAHSQASSYMPSSSWRRMLLKLRKHRAELEDKCEESIKEEKSVLTTHTNQAMQTTSVETTESDELPDIDIVSQIDDCTEVGLTVDMSHKRPKKPS